MGLGDESQGTLSLGLTRVDLRESPLETPAKEREVHFSLHGETRAVGTQSLLGAAHLETSCMLTGQMRVATGAADGFAWITAKTMHVGANYKCGGGRR